MNNEQRYAQYWSEPKKSGLKRSDSYVQFTHGGYIAKTEAADVTGKDYEEIAAALKIENPGF
jgi:hypothetical protein